MSRFPELDRSALTPEAQQTYDEILTARGSISGPFRAWLHSPEFTRRATQLGEFLRYHTNLPPRLSELVILITARLQRSPVEWEIHEPLARQAGLPVEIISALAADAIPQFSDAKEAALHRFCTQLHRDHTADEATVQEVTAAFGEKAVIEIIGLCGYYTMVAMTLNALAIAGPAGKP